MPGFDGTGPRNPFKPEGLGRGDCINPNKKRVVIPNAMRGMRMPYNGKGLGLGRGHRWSRERGLDSRNSYRRPPL